MNPQTPNLAFADENTLTELTGYLRTQDQIKWLREKLYPFDINGKGKPVVLVEVIRARLGGAITPTRSSEPKLRLGNGT